MRALPLALLLLLCVACPALADAAIIHVVRPGETLASIADRYYGNPGRENVLVAENGLTSEGGSSIVVGLRLVIPTVSYHSVSKGETWAQLAKDFYGEPRRAFTLIEANESASGEQPDEGAELLVPYPLRHVSGQNQTLRHVAKGYFGDNDGLTTLRRFNGLKGIRLQRGQILLVPLSDLKLSEEGRAIAQAQGAQPPGGEVRELQARINDKLPALRAHVRGGRYTDAVAMANRLIGGGNLTGNQIVTIERELGTALVALGREDLARRAFAAMFKQQPDVELDLARTSPKVKRVFAAARAVPKEAEPPPPTDVAPAEQASAKDAPKKKAPKRKPSKKSKKKRKKKSKKKKK